VATSLVVTSWSTIGENVGYGGVDQIMGRLLIGLPPTSEGILPCRDRCRAQGGTVWITPDFVG
jgi:hypothetical protein